MCDSSEIENAVTETPDKLISPNSLNQICRSCLKDVKKDYFSLESYYLEKRIIDIYKNVTSIEIEETQDISPMKICILCYDSLIKFDVFKTQAIKSEITLAKILSSLSENEGCKTQGKAELMVLKTDDLKSSWKDEPTDTSEDAYAQNDVITWEENIQKEYEADEDRIFEEDITESYENPDNNENDKITEVDHSQNNAEACPEVKKGKGIKRKGQRKRKRTTASCDLCGKAVRTYRMQDHLRTHTKEKPFICETCGACFSEKGNLTRHIKTHGSDRPFKCAMCWKGFLRPSSRDLHEKTAHNPRKSDKCPLCNKTFKHQYFLNKHIANIHSKQRNTEQTVSCYLCHKAFKNQYYLKKHIINFHNQEEKDIDLQGTSYPCSTCGQLYTTKSSLAVHKLKHEMPKPFLCPICGNGFSTKASLEGHQLIHTGEKNLSCNVCKKKFRFSSTLKTHVLLHTGEKPLACHLCDKQFRQHAHLNTHIRGQHLNERPHKCKHCGKTFKQGCQLKVHTRMHTGEKPYTCNICQKGFHDSSGFNKHMKSHTADNLEHPSSREKADLDVSLGETSTLQIL